MSMEGLVCKNVYKSYKKTEVLNDLNLELEKGKIYGLIGRNGAGKTTLLSLMSGQNPLTSGEIKLDGQAVWENQEIMERICFSREINPMTNQINYNMKIKNYLKMASIYMPKWDQAYAEELIKTFELDVNKSISKLSKGMLSMVTITVALASKAEYTFMDEPVAGVDVVMRDKFYRVLLEEFAESGRTFVISTHIIEEAADVFEEVIMLDGGKILLKENTVELLDRARHISGTAEAVDKAMKGRVAYKEEKLGRSKGVTLLLKPGETLAADEELSVQPMSLQQVFVAMCDKEVS
ncbi:MAG: ABC transporter ATP-binding protein [Lachnospiraceae bacterium]|nr:ABC transporter ATP-binding protein [Lachnospiraceae bacterium]